MAWGEKEKGVLPSAVRKKRYLFPQTPERRRGDIKISLSLSKKYKIRLYILLANVSPAGGCFAPSYRKGTPAPSFIMFAGCMIKIWLSRSVRLQPNRRESSRRQAHHGLIQFSVFQVDDWV